MKKSFALVGTILVIGVLLPWTVRSEYFLHLFILAAMFALLASYWNMLDGYLGLIHFGYAAFVGIGAYGSAILSMRCSCPVALSILIGGSMAAVIGGLMIIPCLRMAGFSTAIVTLAFGEIMRIISTSWTSLTKGEMGLWGIPPIFEGTSKAPFIYLIFGLLAVGLVVLGVIIRSTMGLAFVAIRDDEVAASTTGIPTDRTKIVGTTISCFVAGIVGAFYAHYILTITPWLFGIGYTIQIMAMSLFGGKGTFLGPLAGAFVLVFVSESFRFLADYRLLIYGMLIIATVMIFPEGLAGVASRVGQLVAISWKGKCSQSST